MTDPLLRYPDYEATWERAVAAYIATTVALAVMMVALIVPEAADRTDLGPEGSTYTHEFMYNAFWVVSTCAIAVAVFWIPIGAVLYTKNLRRPVWYMAAGFLLVTVPILGISLATALRGDGHIVMTAFDLIEMATMAGVIGAVAALAGWLVAFRRVDRLKL